MMKNFDETVSDNIGSPENSMLKIARGQHWIEDETEIRFMVIEDPTDTKNIELHALGRRPTAFKTVTLTDLLDRFTRSFGTGS